jgi:hypothetical protein
MKSQRDRVQTKTYPAGAGKKRAFAVSGHHGNESETHHDRIAARAYERYLARGGESGHDLDDWLEAEREVREQRDGYRSQRRPVSSKRT